MEKRCIHCGKTFDDDKTPLCPECLGDNHPENMDVGEIHKLHQEAHNHITSETNRFNAGMVNLIIGGILLILGATFLFLSFKYNVQGRRVFRPTSIEFYVSLICLAISFVLLGMGTVRVVKSLKMKKFFNKVIQDTEIKREKPIKVTEKPSVESTTILRE